MTFSKGDRVKDQYGKLHTVMEQRGTTVFTYDSVNNMFHQTKVFQTDAQIIRQAKAGTLTGRRVG